MKSTASTKIGDEIGLVGLVSGFEAFLAAIAANEVRPVIDRVCSFAKYREAHR